jgi:hypothetical protein
MLRSPTLKVGIQIDTELVQGIVVPEADTLRDLLGNGKDAFRIIMKRMWRCMVHIRRQEINCNAVCGVAKTCTEDLFDEFIVILQVQTEVESA